MAIDLNEAEEYLAFHLEWDAEPKLSYGKQERLLIYARAVDANGLSPGVTGYVDTYTFLSLNAAVLLGWKWKLSAAVELHEDGADEIWEHCKSMVAHWSGIVGDVVLGGTVSGGSGSYALPNIPVW